MSQPDLISLFVVPLNRLGVTYMVTGAVAAIIYGEPRLTNDVDIVIALAIDDVPRLRAAFARPEYYVPPAEMIDAEVQRTLHGHFNIIHGATALKADLYPAGDDPLHRWGLAQRRHVAVRNESVAVAPPEYVVIRKLEYLRASGSDKHRRDIQAILRMVGDQLDRQRILDEVRRLGLEAEWQTLSEPRPQA